MLDLSVTARSVAAGLLLLGACAAPLGRSSSGAPRPNVLVIYTDDQGYGDCGAFNADCRFPTPRLDALAAEGMAFTDAHSASGVCSPSRYALLTGRYAWRTRLKRGVLGADDDCLIEEGRATLPGLLRDAGYATAAIGKWHLGLQIDGTKGARDWSQPVASGPLTSGFDHFSGIPASMNFGALTWFEGALAAEPATLWTRKKFPESEIKARPLDYRMAPPYDAERQGKGDIEVAPSFVDEQILARITDEAVEFVEGQGARPFFCYVALTSPHLPHCTAPEFRGRSGMGNYGDFMLETDHRIGQILDALERTGTAENTLVVVTSDNGPENNYRDWLRLYDHRSSGPWRGGKRDLYEGGHRVPFLVRWPGVVAAGTRSGVLVGQVDLTATVADLLGLELPGGAAEDSLSFASALSGDGVARESLVHHSGAGHFGYRRGDWKLVMTPHKDGPRLELYDLAADPGERADLSALRSEVVDALLEELTEDVLSGRTRPGPPARNDGRAWWPQLLWLEEPGD